MIAATCVMKSRMWRCVYRGGSGRERREWGSKGCGCTSLSSPPSSGPALLAPVLTGQANPRVDCAVVASGAAPFDLVLCVGSPLLIACDTTFALALVTFLPTPSCFRHRCARLCSRTMPQNHHATNASESVHLDVRLVDALLDAEAIANQDHVLTYKGSLFGTTHRKAEIFCRWSPWSWMT